MGTCLEVDPSEIMFEHNMTSKKHLRWDQRIKLVFPNSFINSLGVSIGYNQSDATYGWNGFMEGFTVYWFLAKTFCIIRCVNSLV